MANSEIINRKDPLTGFHTKEGLNEYLSSKVVSVYDKAQNLSIIILDLDHFKSINDKYGHLVGDDALRYFAMVINVALRGRYFVARYGGDEFVIVMEDTADGKDSLEIARRIKTTLQKEKFKTATGLLTFTSSMGISHFPGDGKTARELIEAADQALYFSKKHGRNKAVTTGKLGSYSLQERASHVLKIIIVVIALFFLLLSYQFNASLRNVLSVFNNFSIAIQYKIHHLLYVYNYCEIQTLDGHILKGWVVKESPENIQIMVEKPRDLSNLLSTDPRWAAVPINIPTNRIKEIAKNRR